MWAGVAPIPVWSANNARFRLNRGGNRQTNAAIHRIAITQIRIHPPAQAFITRRLETGSTKREALRLLKRKLANVVYRTLLTDTQQTALADALDIGETHIERVGCGSCSSPVTVGSFELWGVVDDQFACYQLGFA